MSKSVGQANTPASLEEVLTECFDVRGPVFNPYGELTPSGSKAYDKLLNVLGGMLMMGVITESEHERFVRRLDEISDETHRLLCEAEIGKRESRRVQRRDELKALLRGHNIDTEADLDSVADMLLKAGIKLR